MSLNDYFQKHIFEPIGVKNINMFPTPEMISKLCWMNKRSPDGKLSLNENGHLQKRNLQVETDDEKKVTFNAGGHGAFARPVEYCQIIATLLNDGKHPKTGAQLLKKETVDEMFTNQIKEFPDFARQVCAVSARAGNRTDKSNRGLILQGWTTPTHYQTCIQRKGTRLRVGV